MVGLVLYISSINDEMLNRTKDAETYFSYKYGWSFAFAAISFLLTEVTLPTGWVGSGACPGPRRRRKAGYAHPGPTTLPPFVPRTRRGLRARGCSIQDGLGPCSCPHPQQLSSLCPPAGSKAKPPAVSPPLPSPVCRVRG